MQWDFKGFFIGMTVNESSDTAFKQLLTLLAFISGETQFLLQNVADLTAIELVNLLKRRDTVDKLMLFPITIYEFLLMEA